MRGALIAAFVLSVVGCGGDNDNDDDGSCSNLAGPTKWRVTARSTRPPRAWRLSRMSVLDELRRRHRFLEHDQRDSVSLRDGRSDISSGDGRRMLGGHCISRALLARSMRSAAPGRLYTIPVGQAAARARAVRASVARRVGRQVGFWRARSGRGERRPGGVNGVASLRLVRRGRRRGCTEDDRVGLYDTERDGLAAPSTCAVRDLRGG